MKNCCYCSFQSRVGIGDDKPDTVQPAGFKPAQERRPKRTILAITHIHPEDFTVLMKAIRADPHSNNDGLGHDPVIDSGFAIGRIKEHVRVFHFS